MRGRRITTQAELWTFDAFRCDRGGEPYEHAVEQWIRYLALPWMEQAPDARLFLFEDDDGSPIAICGHEALTATERFAPALGVHVDYQGRDLGREVLYSLYSDAAAICPGGSFVFNVDPANQPCLTMIAKLGWAANWQQSLDGPWQEYRIGT